MAGLSNYYVVLERFISEVLKGSVVTWLWENQGQSQDPTMYSPEPRA